MMKKNTNNCWPHILLAFDHSDSRVYAFPILLGN